MLFDWFTVGAQALNFLILVWLMKRFLYQPILHAIDAREQSIAAKLADAAAKETEAQGERDKYLRKNEEFEQQRATLLNEATAEAKAERQRLLDDARKTTDALRATHRESMISEARNLRDALSRQMQDEVFAIARKALSDLASAGLEAHMVNAFLDKLAGMPDEAKTVFATALGTAADPALVRSAFELTPAQHASIQGAIKDAFAADNQVRFETAPGVISGIELSVNGRKLVWSIADYLAAMETNVDKVVLELSKPPAKPDADADKKSTTAATAREQAE
jgi:F-type H+-transporting ATPase subunit b